MNLLCAAGLPGSEHLEIDHCLRTLDKWADAVDRYTRDNLHHFYRNKSLYHGHKGFARLVSMAILLKRGFHLGYQPTAIGNYDFLDSRDDFIHGFVERRLGTCSSFPVLAVAIGRRLGYPLYLAIAKRHVFCQWVGSDGRRLNFEISGNSGDCQTFPDTYYHNWPHPLTSDDLATDRFLRPLDRQEELALFLETRGHCLTDNGYFDAAQDAYQCAARVAPRWARLEMNMRLLWHLEQRRMSARIGGTGFSYGPARKQQRTP